MQDDETVKQEAAVSLDVHLSQLEKSESPRYRRLTALGAGGMGEVWLERDQRIGRDIAIKTVRGAETTPDVTHRFLREACVQGQLEHPAIVPVYDLGWTEAGEPFFTMKRVRGRTLNEILAALARGDLDARARFGQRRLLAAMSQVCLALHFAHERGVVHRDIKPANIMLGDHGEVYVLDWGVAKLAGTKELAGEAVALTLEADETPMTDAGAMMGTLSYMSPEQARGEGGTVDARADVYSLGAVLFEVLTLQRFVCAGPLEEKRTSIIEGVDARISVRFPYLAVAPELEELCVRATRVDPAERIGSAREISDAIERFLDGARDHELRERRVEQHLAQVRARLDAALAGDASLRGEVAREAGAALALSPENLEARRAVLTLLTHPPPQVPAEVERSIAAAREPQWRRYCVNSLIMVALYAPITLLFFTAREHGTLIVSAMFAAYAAIGTIAWSGLRRPSSQGVLPLLLHCAWVATMVPMLALTHPLLVVPAVTAIMVQVGSLQMMSRWTVSVLVVAIAPLAGATLLALTGVWGDPGRFSNGEVHLSSNIDDRYGTIMLVTAWLMSILPIVMSAFLAIAVRHKADDAERAVHLSRWQLAQLVPAELGTDEPSA